MRNFQVNWIPATWPCVCCHIELVLDISQRYMIVLVFLQCQLHSSIPHALYLSLDQQQVWRILLYQTKLHYWSVDLVLRYSQKSSASGQRLWTRPRSGLFGMLFRRGESRPIFLLPLLFKLEEVYHRRKKYNKSSHRYYIYDVGSMSSGLYKYFSNSMAKISPYESRREMFSLVALTHLCIIWSNRKFSALYPVKRPEHTAKNLACRIKAQFELSDSLLCFSFMYDCGAMAGWRRHLLVA